MTLQVLGTIDGKRIELERETGLPTGAQVLVVIHPQPLSLAEKRHLVDVLCGAWAEDVSLGPIFAQIEQQRATSESREVDFSVSS